MQRTEGAALFDLGTGGVSRTATADIAIQTARTTELIDITDQVSDIVGEAGIQTGIVLVSTPHTTCAVIVNEAEEGFARDFVRFLEGLVPENGDYEHDNAPHPGPFEAPNGYAHIRASLLSSPSIMLPVRDGDIGLGQWQRIFFVELDHSRPRTCQVTILGR